MDALHKLDIYVLRYTPDAIKQESANVGVVMVEEGGEEQFAEVQFTHDWRRVRCLDYDADVEMLRAMENDIRSQLRDSESRLKLLQKMEGYSNGIELCPVSGCLTQNPAEELGKMVRHYLKPRVAARGPARSLVRSNRQTVVDACRRSFEEAGVWEWLLKEIAVAPFTAAGDPLKIDFGYRVGKEIKMFHALSLKKNVEQAVALAYRFPKLADGILRERREVARLTAVVDEMNGNEPHAEFALGLLSEHGVGVGSVEAMGEVAKLARAELMG